MTKFAKYCKINDTAFDIRAFTSYRLCSFRDYPLMWGSLEAVEMQAIMLIEVEAKSFLRIPNQDGSAVYNTYLHVLKELYPNTVTNNLKLHELQPEPKDFGQTLYDVCNKTREKLIKKFG